MTSIRSAIAAALIRLARRIDATAAQPPRHKPSQSNVVNGMWRGE